MYFEFYLNWYRIYINGKLTSWQTVNSKRAVVSWVSCNCDREESPTIKIFVWLWSMTQHQSLNGFFFVGCHKVKRLGRRPRSMIEFRGESLYEMRRTQEAFIWQACSVHGVWLGISEIHLYLDLSTYTLKQVVISINIVVISNYNYGE